MGLLRKALLVLLIVLLAVDLAAANTVVAAERTVLNPDFVTTTLEEENAYERVEPLVLDELPTDELEGVEAQRLPIDPEPVVAAAVDPEYLQSQLEPNIDRTYAYLHGNEDELELSVDLEPAKSAITAAVEAELANASPTELLGAVAANEDIAFEARGVEFDLRTVGRMAENRSVYRAERAALRETIRNRVIDRLVNETLDRASNDELLALAIDGYDPTAYNASEKEQLVEENEPQIRTAVRNRIEEEQGAQIDAEVDQRLSIYREGVKSEVESNLNDSLGDVDPAVAEPATDLALVIVDGYLADMSHSEFRSEFEAATDDLAAGVATVIERQLDEEVPDRVDLTDEFDAQDRQNLREARRAVGLIDLLAIALPLVAIVLIGLIYVVSRSVSLTLIGTGLGLSLGGLPVLLGVVISASRLEAVLEQTELPGPVGALVLSILDQIMAAVQLQSAVVVGAGLVCLAAGLLLYFGVITRPGRPDRA